MKKELRKAIYTKSRLRNNFCKNATKENEKSAKYNQINVSLRKRILRNILKTFPKMVPLPIKFFRA